MINFISQYHQQNGSAPALVWWSMVRTMLWVVALLIGMSLITLTPLAQSASNDAIPAPTIISPQPSEITTQHQTVFTGLTKNNTHVDVYVDGIFNGKAAVKNHVSGTASWSYTSFVPLAPGEHIVYTVARSEDEMLRSIESSHIAYSIEAPFSSPTLVGLAASDSHQKPLITGLAVNGSTIEVFVDGLLNGSFTVTDHESGTANFAYQPTNDLLVGWHSVSVRASNADGKTSPMSSSLVFEVAGEGSDRSINAPQVLGVEHTAATEVTAPTLIEPAPGTATINRKPIIKGVARANTPSTVEVFIDGVLNGEIAVASHESGTAAFSYTPFLSLEQGTHTVTAHAVTETGEKSGSSNTLSFIVRPSNNYLIVNPSGVRTFGAVLATSTSEDSSDSSDSQAMTDDDRNSEDNTTDDTVMSNDDQSITVTDAMTDDATISVIDSDSENTSPTVTDNSDNTPETEGDDTDDTNEPTTTSTEIVIIGQNATSSPTSTAGTSRTGVIIALAIAAIVIIGLISWFTSGKQEVEEIPSDDKPLSTGDNNTPPEGAVSSEIWETEPIDTPTFDANDYQEPTPRPSTTDVPPPPPPPLGL